MDIKDKVNYMMIHNDNYDYHYEDYDGYLAEGFTNIIFNESTNELIYSAHNYKIIYDKGSGISIKYKFLSSTDQLSYDTSIFELDEDYAIIYIEVTTPEEVYEVSSTTIYNLNDQIKDNQETPNECTLSYILEQLDLEAALNYFDYRTIKIRIKTSKIIQFEDSLVEQICWQNYGAHYYTNSITEYEAAQVQYLDQRFQETAITKFNELKYFTGIKKFTYENSSGNNIGTKTVNGYTTGQFYACTSLTEVTLPEVTVSTDITGIFWGCTALTKIDFSPLTKNYNLHGALSSMCRGCTNLQEVIMPTGVYNSTNAQNRTMFHAFYNCPKLKKVIFKDNVDFNGIRFNDYSIASPTQLKEIEFLGSVSNFGSDTSYSCYIFKNCRNLNRKSMVRIINGLTPNVSDRIIYFYDNAIKTRLYSKDCEEAINKGWCNLWKILYINGIQYEHWLYNYNSTSSIRIGTNITLSNLQNFTFNSDTRVLSFPIKCGALSMDLSCQTGQNFTIGLSGVDLFEIGRNCGIIYYAEHACNIDELIFDIIENEEGSMSYVGSNSTTFCVIIINSFGAPKMKMGKYNYAKSYPRTIYGQSSAKSTNIQTHIELNDFYCPKGSLIILSDRTTGATVNYSISATQNSSLEDIYINSEYWYVDYGVCITKIIDTGIIPTSNMRMRAEFLITINPYSDDPDPTQKHMIIGNIQGDKTGTGFFQIFASNNRTLSMAWAHSSVKEEKYTNRASSSSTLDDRAYDITIDKDGFTIYCPNYNGTESKTFSGTVIENNANYHLLLYPVLMLHRLRIWDNIDSTPTLIHEIVGVRNNLNSKEGLYDLITGKFWSTKYDNYEVEV